MRLSYAKNWFDPSPESNDNRYQADHEWEEYIHIYHKKRDVIGNHQDIFLLYFGMNDLVRLVHTRLKRNRSISRSHWVVYIIQQTPI